MWKNEKPRGKGESKGQEADNTSQNRNREGNGAKFEDNDERESDIMAVQDEAFAMRATPYPSP